MQITVQVVVDAPIEAVWRAFNNPADILRWDASAEWRTTSAVNDLKVGGRLELRIEARSGRAGFDFGATYTDVRPMRVIAWRSDRDQRVCVEFQPTAAGVVVRQTFDADPAPSPDEQKRDWQDVLDSFARHVGATVR